jgi:hypothetical protein
MSPLDENASLFSASGMDAVRPLGYLAAGAPDLALGLTGVR